MKKLILITLAIINSIVALAQVDLDGQPQTEQQAIETLNKAEFIFEGKIIDQQSFYDSIIDNNGKVYGDIYNTYTIQIDHILSGENILKIGIVTVIDPLVKARFAVTEYGTMIINKDIEYQWEPIGLPKYGIYFCEVSERTLVGNLYPLSIKGNDNQIVLKTIYQNIDFSILELRTDRNETKKFKSKQDIYEYLKQQENIIIPREKEKKEEDKEQTIKKKDASGSLDVKNKDKYAQNLSNYEKYMQQVQVKVANATNKSNACKEFFISEYTDGPQKNKVIEIFNPSDSVKSLNGYSIKIFNNGAPTPLDIPLSGIVNPKETYVVTHPQADPQILSKAHQTDVKMNFDGNDAIVLNKGTSTYIDKIGEIGVNPGVAGWNVPPGASTKEQDLRRKHPIDQGETDWTQGKNQWDAFPQDSLGNIKQHQNTCSSILLVNDLSFSFDNVIETGTSPRYLEFDVMAEANNNSTYFDNCLLRIQYNPTAFGSNVVANNKVTITKGATYNSVTYIDPDANAIDQTTSVMGVPFGTDFGQSSWNRTLVTTTPTQILHFKMEITSCNQNSTIDFTDITFTPMFSFYAVNATDNIVNTLSYDNTSYLNSINEVLCELKITNFTSPVYPGTWYQGTPTSEYLLTIQGNGFGATRGSGNVYFPNAHNGGQNYTPLDSYDFLTWIDNQIQIRMPSLIDSLPFQSRTPGSGIFYVKTNTGDSVLSSTPIDIPYGIKNAKFSLPLSKVRMDLANVNNSDSIAITFLLDTGITNNPMIETIVRRAVADWKCETLVYFETGGSTTLTSAPDGISVIHFTNSLSSGVLAETSIYPSTVIQCLDNNGNKHVFPKEIDIAFLRNPAQPWYFDTVGTLPVGMLDFYEVALHEVGHGNLLQHVNAPTIAGNDDELMFWSALVGPVSLTNRRTIDLEAANGGFDVVQISNSLNINFGTCNAANVGTLLLSPDQSCGGLIGFEELFANNVEFSLYPNPTKDGFSLDYELKRNAAVQFTFLDYMGRELKRFDLKKESTGQHKLFVETSNLTAGLYFLVATIDGKIQTLKVIKQ